MLKFILYIKNRLFDSFDIQFIQFFRKSFIKLIFIRFCNTTVYFVRLQKMIDKVTLDNGLTFKLTKENHNAKVIYSPKAMGVILVPRSITIQSQEYLITEINEKSFKNNKLIKQLKFTKDSALISIQKESIINSQIQHLTIPPSVEEFISLST